MSQSHSSIKRPYQQSVFKSPAMDEVLPSNLDTKREVNQLAYDQLAEQAQQTRTQFFVYLSTLGYLAITVLSITDKDLLLNDQPIILPLLNVGVLPSWILGLSSTFCLIVFCSLQIHWYRYRNRIIALNFQTESNIKRQFPFALYQAMYHPSNDAVGLIETLIARIALFLSFPLVQFTFLLKAFQLHEIGINSFVVLVTILSFVVFQLFLFRNWKRPEEKNVKHPFKPKRSWWILFNLITSLVLMNVLAYGWEGDLGHYFILIFSYTCVSIGIVNFCGYSTKIKTARHVVVLLIFVVSMSFVFLSTLFQMDLGGKAIAERMTLVTKNELISPSKELLKLPVTETVLAQLKAYKKDPEKQEYLNHTFDSLYWFDLSERHLEGADLSYSTIIKSDLSNVQLPKAILIGTNLALSNLKNANLQGANLHHANLWDADLSKAQLQNANLIRADLIYADLSEAHLEGAYFSVEWDDNLKKYKRVKEYTKDFDKLCHVETLKGATLDQWMKAEVDKQCPEKLHLNPKNSHK